MKKTTTKKIADEQQKLYETSLIENELQEYRLFGSPGTGKTTTMSKQIVNAVNKHGSDKVLIASFTRTAAAELAGRKLPIPKQNIATLHAHAYRSLGRPDLIDTAKWNQFVYKINPEWQLSSAVRESAIEEPDMPNQKTDGDKLMSKYDLLRASMLPLENAYDENVREFGMLYEQFKKDTETIDFTDMIALALESVDEVPSSPTVGFFDEVQDFTPLELALVRKWGTKMQYVVLAGDDDQTLFSFKGATPNAFLYPEVSENYIRVLPQSYRVPKQIHTLAVDYVQKLSKRQYKQYMPRFEVEGFDDKTNRRIYNDKHIADGEVERRRFNINDWNYCEQMIGEAVDLNEDGYSAMFLTACSYQLETLKNCLRHNGVMFHNPFRTVNGGWNPLGKEGTLNRVATFLYATNRQQQSQQQTWTAKEFLHWSDIVKATGVFKRGVLSRLKNYSDDYVIEPEMLASFFENEVHHRHAINGNFHWLQVNSKSTYEKRIKYILKVIDRYGINHVLNNKPKIVIGTIHSVKGGEADRVYLSPDLSPQGYKEYLQNQDNTIRQYYVGMTRAFQSLHILQPSGNQYARI